MEIKQIRILNYGKWHHVTIPFESGVNILYGKNEAGKTTLISFIKGVLFGFLQRRTSHKNYIPKNSKNYGGQLDVLSKGQEYIIQRMAGKNGGDLTILDPHGHQLANDVLTKLLRPFDRGTFNALYYFGTVDLQKMGKLKQRDLVYRIQRIGLSHSDDWINLREALLKQSKRLYSPRGYKPPLNQELKQYLKLIDQSKVAKKTYQNYQNLLSEIKRLKLRKWGLKHQLKLDNQKADQLKHDRDVWLRYRKMMELRPVIKAPVRRGFTNQDVNQLRKLNRRLSDLNNQVALVHQQIHELSQEKVVDELAKNYYYRRTKINGLSDYFNDIQRQIHKLSLIRSRKSDVDQRLKILRKSYSFHHHELMPMSTKDLRTVNNLRLQLLKNQTRNRNLERRLVTSQAHKPFSRKDYAIDGLGILLIITGIIIKLWLLSGLGLLILVLGFLMSNYKGHQKVIRQIQAELERLKRFSDQIVNKLRAFQTKYRYPGLNVESWIANQNNLKQLRKASADDKVLNRKLDTLRQMINKYFDEWSFMNREMTLSSDDSTRLLQLKNYVNKMEHVIKINQQIDRHRQKLLIKLSNLQSHQKRTKDLISEFYQYRHVNDNDQFDTVKDQQVKLIKQRKTYHELLTQIGNNEFMALKKYRTFNDLKSVSEQMNQRIMGLRSQSQEITSQLTRLQVKLRQMVHNGSYDELQQRIANLRTQINELAKRWLMKTLAAQWINATLNLATKGRVPKIKHRATINFQILTNHRYSSIIFNKSKIKVMRKDKQRFTLYELSKGTVQQLYLALVFAMAQVFSVDYPMPILIDDGFTDFDISRKQAAIKLLKSIGKKLQVIYCTSDYTLANYPDTIKLSQIEPK